MKIVVNHKEGVLQMTIEQRTKLAEAIELREAFLRMIENMPETKKINNCLAWEIFKAGANWKHRAQFNKEGDQRQQAVKQLDQNMEQLAREIREAKNESL
jgi:hypothetical protein